jgi:SAM-dependent methyltransferase
VGDRARDDPPGNVWEADAGIQERIRRRYHALGLLLEPGERLHCRKVLHLACGCGFSAHCLAEIGLACSEGYLGVDPDPERIETARARLPDLLFCAADPEGHLPAGDFDLAVADGVLEHLKHPKRFIRRLRRGMATPAWLLVAVPYRQPAEAPEVGAGRHLMFGVDEQRLGNLLEPEFEVTATRVWCDREPGDADHACGAPALMAKARISGPEFLLLSRPEEMAEALARPRMVPRPAGG